MARVKAANRFQMRGTFVVWHRAEGYRLGKLQNKGPLVKGFAEYTLKTSGKTVRDGFTVDLDAVRKISTPRLLWRALFKPQRVPVSYATP
jgi:hypothetical protein